MDQSRLAQIFRLAGISLGSEAECFVLSHAKFSVLYFIDFSHNLVTCQSDKRLVSNFANEMEKLNSLASIDSKEMIIEGSNNEYKG
ncbi:unnamed protein product [Brugia timori]|uniref:Uncharacterized protein n=1 Tax=Brugia timori TaxID=42155 RepID=A0A3P7Z9S6_9BILA|nr:unnamed protein product [Brugia timori]